MGAVQRLLRRQCQPENRSMKLFFASLFFLLLFSACVKDDHRVCCAMPPVEFVRTQTQCADIWGYGATNDATIAKLNSYLLQQKITADKITLQATGEQAACAACVCSNGFVFHVWAKAQYIDSLTTLGFIIK